MNPGERTCESGSQWLREVLYSASSKVKVTISSLGHRPSETHSRQKKEQPPQARDLADDEELAGVETGRRDHGGTSRASL